MARGNSQRTVETATTTTTTTTTTHIDDHETHRKGASLMGGVASLVKSVSSITIICITRLHVDDRLAGCFFSVGLSYSVCQYAYALGGIGIVLALLAAATQCGPLARMGRGSATGQSLVHGLNMAWWVAGAVVLSIYHSQAESNGLPPSSYRKGVLALAWICAILSLIMYALANMLGCGPRHKKTIVEKTLDVV